MRLYWQRSVGMPRRWILLAIDRQASQLLSLPNHRKRHLVINNATRIVHKGDDDSITACICKSATQLDTNEPGLLRWKGHTIQTAITQGDSRQARRRSMILLRLPRAPSIVTNPRLSVSWSTPICVEQGCVTFTNSSTLVRPPPGLHPRFVLQTDHDLPDLDRTDQRVGVHVWHIVS